MVTRVQPAFEPGDVAYVRRNAAVDEAGEEVVATDPTAVGSDAAAFETVLQEVLVLSVQGTQAVVAHSGGRHRYHVGWLLAEPDGPEEVKPREWNP